MVERLTITLGILTLFFVWSRTRELPIGRFVAEVINNGSLKSLAIWVAVGLVAILQISGAGNLSPVNASWKALLAIKVFGIALYVLGVSLAAWAKLTLGPNWDPETEDRPLVTTGPYSLMPHPIYTGGFLAAVGAQMTLASWLVLLALPGILVIRRVIKGEEKELFEEFGEQYQRYLWSTTVYRLFARLAVRLL